MWVTCIFHFQSEYEVTRWKKKKVCDKKKLLMICFLLHPIYLKEIGAAAKEKSFCLNVSLWHLKTWISFQALKEKKYLETGKSEFTHAQFYYIIVTHLWWTDASIHS